MTSSLNTMASNGENSDGDIPRPVSVELQEVHVEYGYPHTEEQLTIVQDSEQIQVVAKSENEEGTNENTTFDGLNGVTALFIVQQDHSYCVPSFGPKSCIVKQPKLKTCNICGADFVETNYRQSLAKHLTEVHSEGGKGACDVCGHRCENSKTSYSAAILKHREKHFSNHPQTNSRQSSGRGKRVRKVSRSDETAETTEETIIDGETVAESNIIDDEFVDENDTVEKKIKKEKPVFGACENCGKSFKSEAWLLQHLKKRICFTNKEPTTEKSALKEAEIKKEKGSSHEELQCEHCKQGFVSQAALRLHQRRDHHAAIKCEACSLAFPSTSSLQRHKNSCRRTIRSSKPKSDAKGQATKNKCDSCNRTFPTVQGLTRHQVLMGHRKHEKPLVKEITKQEQQKKQFACETCKETFPNQRSLSRHGHLHLEEKKYFCEHCNLQFLKASQLEVHRSKKHPSTTDATFQCSICNKAFPKTSDLDWHSENVHVTCGVCKKVFATMRQLTKHSSLEHESKDESSSETRQRSYGKPARNSSQRCVTANVVKAKTVSPRGKKTKAVQQKLSVRSKVTARRQSKLQTATRRSVRSKPKK